MNEQEVMRTLALIAQQGDGDMDKTIGAMVSYLTSNGMEEEQALEVASQVYEQIVGGQEVGTNPDDVSADDEDSVAYDKCGGSMKKKAKKACGGIKVGRRYNGGYLVFYKNN